MPGWAQGQENFKDYILGKYDTTPKTPEWAATRGCRRKTSRSWHICMPPPNRRALKASWAPGRNAYGEQYCRMSHALQATPAISACFEGCLEGIGKAWHAEGVAYPYDQYANVFYASIKSRIAGRILC
ncbi:MAG: hypothetical protein R3E89_14550 [Thiolinea sp.]